MRAAVLTVQPSKASRLVGGPAIAGLLFAGQCDLAAHLARNQGFGSAGGHSRDHLALEQTRRAIVGSGRLVSVIRWTVCLRARRGWPPRSLQAD